MVVAQNIHRQVEYCTIKPPTMGPMAAPVSGTSRYMLRERPLCLADHTSPNTPKAMLYTALAPKPASSRAAMSRPLELAKPQMRFQTRNQMFVKWKMGLRP